VASTGSAQASGATVDAWGLNANGELGNGNDIGPDTCSGKPCAKQPHPVSNVSGATQLAGGIQGLALLANGTVNAWGYNADGEVGNGSTTDVTTPVSVNGLSHVVAVAAGTSHSLALLSNGRVMAWGDNSAGQLGIGNATGPDTCGSSPCSKNPVPVPGLSRVIAIGAGYLDSLALLSNGTVVVWGYNHYGEDGDGVGTQTGCMCVTSPTRVPGLSGVVAFAAGGYASGLALLRDGTVRDWGYNYDGELGNGTTTRSTTCGCLGAVQVSGLSRVRSISGGSEYALALQSDGRVKAWGYNHDGELGNGTTSTTGCQCMTTPVAVNVLTNVRAISAGTDPHAFALLPNGTLEGWGVNYFSQLGDGTTTSPRDAPVPVSGLGGVSGIAGTSGGGLALIGPSHALSISLAGTGRGAVGGPGVLCPGSCSSRYPLNQVEILRAQPAPGTGFAGFTGACAGIHVCAVTLGKDQRVTATFGRPKGTTITKAKISKRKGAATFRFAAPGAITGFQCELIKPKRAHHKQQKPHFSNCRSPKRYKHLKAGSYTFEVRALDILGADAVPARKKFAI
jgi:alpha-tubulin suppressor-like RCC1 family protein